MIKSIEVTENLWNAYPTAIFGSLTILNFENIQKHSDLEEEKRNLENLFREHHRYEEIKPVINKYIKHFKKWSKSYPIDFQITSILKGKNFPTVSVLVDSMFLAELKNGILTSGHDLDKIEGDEITFDLTKSNEEYLKINNQKQIVKEGDIALYDIEEILANVLYGPAKRSAINKTTKNALFLAWCPQDISEDAVKGHLQNIFTNLKIIKSGIYADIQIYVP